MSSVQDSLVGFEKHPSPHAGRRVGDRKGAAVPGAVAWATPAPGAPQPSSAVSARLGRADVRGVRPASKEVHVHRLDGSQHSPVKGGGGAKGLACPPPCSRHPPQEPLRRPQVHRPRAGSGSQKHPWFAGPATPCGDSPVLAEGRLPRGARGGLGFPGAAGCWFQHSRDKDAGNGARRNQTQPLCTRRGRPRGPVASSSDSAVPAPGRAGPVQRWFPDRDPHAHMCS